MAEINSVILPSDILKEYAKNLTEQSDGKLKSECYIERKNNYICNYLIINNFKVIKIDETMDVYPVSLYLNGTNLSQMIAHNIETSSQLEKQLDILITSEEMSDILNHLLKIYKIQHKND